jgi:hypothetical protein
MIADAHLQGFARQAQATNIARAAFNLALPQREPITKQTFRHEWLVSRSLIE